MTTANDSTQPVQIVTDLLAHPYPHDLMAIRRKVEREYGHGCGIDEDMAREEMDTYCTEDFMLDARRKWQAAQSAARDWLSSQNADLDARRKWQAAQSAARDWLSSQNADGRGNREI